MQLSDILTFPVTTVTPDCRVNDALQLMRDQRISSLVVVENGRPVGIFTERDAVLLAYRHQPTNSPVGKVMGKPLVTAPPNMDYRDGYRLIEERRMRHLVVVDAGGALAGVVSISDFLEHLSSESLIRFKSVGEVMIKSVVTLPLDATVDDAVRLMLHERLSCMVVQDNGRPKGIFTERDLVRLSVSPESACSHPLSEVMSKPVYNVTAEIGLPEAIREMDRLHIRRLVVVNAKGFIDGLVTRHDVVKQLYDRHVKHLIDALVKHEVELAEAKEELNAVRELKRTEERLLETQHLARIGSWELDLSTDHLWWSNEIYNIFEIDPREFAATYEAFLDRVHPEDRELVDRTYRESVSEHGDYEIVHRLRFQEGRIKYVHERGKSIYDNSGKPQRSIGTVQDITNQIEVAQLLQASEQRLQAIIETIPHGIQENDCDGTITFSNRAHHRILGYPDGQLLGKKIWDMLESEEEVQGLKRYLQYLLDDQPEPEPFIGRNRRHDGESVWLQIDWNYRRDENGTIIGFTSVITDITEHKITEDELHRSEERLREVIENMPVMLDAVDEAGNLIVWNREAERVTGYTAKEVVGDPKAWEKLYPDSAYRESMLKAWEIRGDHRNWLWRLQAKDGTERFIEWSNISGEYPIPGWSSWGIGVDVTERKRALEEVSQANTEWIQALDGVDDAVYLLDMERHLIKANRAFYMMIRKDPENCLGRHIVELIHPEGEETPCLICRAQEAHEEINLTMEPGDPNNPTGQPIEITLKLVRNDAGVATGMLMSLHDLSQSREMVHQLRITESVFLNTDEGISVTDIDGTILDVNPAFTQITGYSREEVIGQNPRILQSGRHDERFYKDMWESITQIGFWRGEIWNRTKEGSLIPELLTISCITNDRGETIQYIGVFTDIGQIKQAQEQLEYLSHHDALTGLPNRLLLTERLEQAIRHAERNQTLLALIFCDLDRFKRINDSLGHTAGDLVLQSVSKKLTRTVRKEDTVARIGGDEFVVILEDEMQPENIAGVAKKLLHAIEQPDLIGGQEIKMTASLGICLYPHDGKDTAELLRNADTAMYRAKEEGRNNFQFYTEELTRNVFEHVLLENSLRQALNNRELVLYYQPQIDFQDQRIIGAEALLRWQHPQLGLILPARFIPIAQESGLIVSIGEWVLQEVCEQARRWLDLGINIERIAVNIDGQQIQRGGLVEVVESALAGSGLQSSHLELEVTEGFIMQNPASEVEQLRSLQQLGITLAIDDFGTGYSSLSYLKKLPIDKLKIDQSFVRDIPKDANDMAIADAVIAMGKSLGLRIIAEGVETEEQADFLRKAGCQVAQGYLYGKPLPADEFEQLFR